VNLVLKDSPSRLENLIKTLMTFSCQFLRFLFTPHAVPLNTGFSLDLYILPNPPPERDDLIPVCPYVAHTAAKDSQG
jgi:hypothetical protein